MDKFREDLLLGGCLTDEWDLILKAYKFPERPCDTRCLDDCPARPDCPLFTAWKRRKVSSE